LGICAAGATVLVSAACGGAAATGSSASLAASPAASVKPPASSPAAVLSAAADAKPAGSASTAAKPAASAAAGASPNTAGGSLEKLKYGSVPGVSGAGTYIAIDRGYFREVGLDVEVTVFPGGPEMIPSLATSKVDVGNIDPGAGVFNSLSRDLPLRWTADANHTEKGHSNLALVIRKDLIDNGTIKDLPDLKGKKISPIGKGSLVDLQVRKILALGHVSDADVELPYMNFPDALAALGKKALDGALLNEPLVSAAVDQGIGIRWKGMDELFGNLQNTAIMYTPDFVTKRQDAGKRFMLAYLRGARDYIAAFDQGKDRDAIVAIMAKNTTIKDPATYGKVVMPAMDPNGKLNIQSIKDYEQWFADNGYVPKPVPLDDFFDTSYADAALATLGRR
jgi:NitT/TauT family transport system substrate-binding protein